MSSFIFINLNIRRGIKMRYYKFLLIIVVASMLLLSVSAVTGTQTHIFSGEKLKNNDQIISYNPFTMNRLGGGVFQSIISHFIKLIPIFIKTTFINGISKESKIGEEQIEPIIIENQEKDEIKQEEETIIIDEHEDKEEDVIENDNNDVDNNPDVGEEVDDEDGNQQKGFELELTLELNQQYKVGRPIPVKAILKNIGDKPVIICEMDAKLKTLDFVIDTPLGKTIHYIGPFEGEAKIVKLAPFESIISEINLTASNVTFGDKSVGSSLIIKPYTFIEGDYTISGLYTSDYIEEWEHSDFWHGSLNSPSNNFLIGP
jgi:hypothetical protein